MILFLMLQEQCGFKGINMEKIYLDHASSMPIDKRVLKFALPYLNEKFGNPSSLYNFGLESREAIEKSRGCNECLCGA